MVHIVLVEPEIPQNTGNVARTCAVTGSELHLVGPLGFRIDNASLKRAGLDYWHLLTIHTYDSLEEYLAQNPDVPKRLATTRATRSHVAADYPEGCHLLFGKETAGLPQGLVDAHPADTIRIPQLPQARCLNLSNAVAVTVYEALRQQNFPGMQ